MLRHIPPFVRRSLIRRAALAPPLFKTPNFQRLCARMCDNNLDEEQLVETNLGIASQIRCRIPFQKAHYVFGRPQNHVPERGTIALVNELSEDCLHFLDVGAHEGVFTFSVFHSRGKDIVLHWFEPDQALSSRLYENLKRNSVEAGTGLRSPTRTVTRPSFEI
jgi:hypothetical protein